LRSSLSHHFLKQQAWLISPFTKVSCVEARQHTEFSAEELEKFEYRYENGYNLNTDERYNRWLRMYHPDECCDTDQSSSFSEHQVVISDCQKLLTVPDALPTIELKPKQTARVLTVPEYMQQMKEKELKKKEEALKKEECKLARERKAKERRETVEKKARRQEERRRKANTLQTSRSRGKNN
jgi:hypothetical protein